MNRSFFFGIKKIIFFYAVCVSSLVFAEKIDHAAMYRAYLSGDLTYWGNVLSCFSPNDIPEETLLDVVNYEYGYIPWCIDRDLKNEAKSFIDKFESHLLVLEQIGYDKSVVLSYRSALNAYRFTFEKRFSYAKNSLNFIKIAFEQAPENPFILNLKGCVEFFAPAVFGGSNSDALAHFEKAVRLYEEGNMVLNNWNYLAAKFNVVQALKKMGSQDKAIEKCMELLDVDPDFAYVRDVYFPELLKK